MKNKKALIVSVASACALIILILIIVLSVKSCSKDDKDDSSKETHTHTYATEWSKNETKHWHASTCGDDVKGDEADHTYGEWSVVKEATTTEKGQEKRSCAICGYEDYKDIAVIVSYTVTWVNYDDSILEKDTLVKLGTIPTYDSDEPVKDVYDGYEYTFKGWDKEISAVNGDVTYKAQYDSTLVYEYTTNTDGTLTITKYTGSKTQVVIPSTIDGKTVTALGDGNDYMFNNSSVTSVKIPDTVITLKRNVFEMCTNIKKIIVGNGVTTIENNVFHYISSINIYYNGTLDEWTSISIGTNVPVIDIVLYYYSESKPVDNANKYWHYVDGAVTVWE